MENTIDTYQVMKIAGEHLDVLMDDPSRSKEYYDWNNLWWDAATIYVPEMHRLNQQSKNSH